MDNRLDDLTMIQVGFRMLVPLFALFAAAAQSAGGEVGKVTRYVAPEQQTAVAFGGRSHWLQPWRAYLETVPASRLTEAVGINLNLEPDEADAVCRHLAKNGFCKARLEFGWGGITWNESARLADPGRFEKLVRACKRYGLRPLFLLNAHHRAPCPVRFFDVRLVAAAKKGDRTIHIAKEALPSLIAGRSGLSELTDYWAAEVLFTKIEPDGSVRALQAASQGPIRR